LSIARLASLLAGADESLRWRLVTEFLEEYRWEPPDGRVGLLADEPAGTGDERWDVFLAALAEHLAARDGHAAPFWAESRTLRRFLVSLQFTSSSGRRSGPRARRFPASGRVRGGPGVGGRVSVDDPLLDRKAIEEAFRRLRPDASEHVAVCR